MKRIISFSSLVLVFILISLVISCNKGNGSNNANVANNNANTVSIVNMAFNPLNITVRAGTKVTWTNNDIMAHTVTADDGSFSSGNIPSGSVYSFTFSVAGTFNYHCAIHPSMIAAVTVN
jgi:plastocyanin